MRKKIKKSKKKSWIKFYLFLYLSCFILLAASYGFMKLYTNLHLPCANSISCKEGYEEITENGRPAVFAGKTITPPDMELIDNDEVLSVLGIKDNETAKHIFVDLKRQRLFAYEGTGLYMEAIISTGRWGRTPIGNYNIWSKFRSTRMTGGSGSDYYDLPNVPYAMFFYGDYGIHGAYWHNNFGHEMSHGCVNMRIVDSKKLFEWAQGPAGGQKGTEVSICNSFEAPDKCLQN